MIYLLLFLLLLPLPAWANSIILDATTQTLKLTTSTTASIDYTVTYADHTTTSFVPGLSKGNIATATTTTILSAPASSTQRQVKWLSLQNNSATTANVVTLKLDVSGTTYNLGPSLSLELGESLQVGTEGRFTILTANGLVKVSSSAVTGTFWQATQPVSIASMPSTPVTGTFWQATQPVSGTVTTTPPSNASTNVAQMAGVTPSLNTGVRDAGTQRVTVATNDSVPVTGTFWQATQPVSGTFWQATQPVSGTVTTTPPSNASTNVAQIGGVATSMNTGVRDTGTQRVTIATNDSVPVTGTFFQGTQPVSGTFWQATQPVSIASMPSTPVTGTFWQATQPVSGTVTTTPPSNASTNVAQIGGTNSVNGGLAGSQSIGGTAATNAVINQNPVLVACEANSAQPAAATTGRQRQTLCGLDGSQYIRYGGPIVWSCGVTAIGTTLTQCQAAPGAGLSLYITDVVTQSNTATAGLFTLRFGTGSNCGTGTGNLFFASASALMASPANTSPVNHFHLTVPMQVTAANAVCVLGVATNTTNAQINGFTAP